MKKTIIGLALVTAFVGAQVKTARAHDRSCGFNPVGAVFGGLVAGAIIADAFAPRPVYYAPAPQPVYCPPPAPVYCPPPAPVYCPPRVVYAPAPVYYAAPQRDYYCTPRPVYYSQPVVSVRFGQGWGWGGHGRSYGRGYEQGRGYDHGRGYDRCD